MLAPAMSSFDAAIARNYFNDFSQKNINHLLLKMKVNCLGINLLLQVLHRLSMKGIF